jgi:tetratricopeptide (TPR) repeat protein
MYEAAYAALTENDRILGHKLAGAWLEAHGEQDFAVLARHFERGGQRERAAEFCYQAAQQAMEVNDLAGALSYAEHGVRCGAQGTLLGQLRLLQTEIHNWRAEFVPAEQFGLEALRRLERGSAAWFRAVGEVVLASGRLNRPERLVALTKTLHAMRWGPELGSPPLIAAARAVPRLVHAGFTSLATALLNRIAQVLPTLKQDPLAQAWCEMALAEKASAEFARDLWLAHSLRSSEAFLRVGDRRNACMQRMDAGFAHLRLGQFADSIRVLQETLKEAEALQLYRVPAAAMRALCLAYASTGDLVRGEEAARTGI